MCNSEKITTYLKPMLFGFLFYLVMLLALTLIYTTSKLQPLTGFWQISVNGEMISDSFPINIDIQKGESFSAKKTVDLPPNRDFLTFSIYPTIQGELYVNGHHISSILPELEKMQRPPPYLFLSYQIPQAYLDDHLDIQITARGPQRIILSYPPMLANSEIIKGSYFRVHFVESYIYLIAFGVQLVIVFLMFIIGHSMQVLRKSYLNIGFGTLLQASYLAYIILSFNTNLFYNSHFYDYFVPLLMMISFIFLFHGLEYYILKQFRLTPYFWWGIPFVIAFYLFTPLEIGLKHRISIVFLILMNLYMIHLAIKKTKIKLLQYSLFILLFSILNDFYFREKFRAFPLPSMQQNALMIMSFVFGSFFTYHFIKNYTHEKRLRIELSDSLEELRVVNEELESSYGEIEILNNSLEEKVKERTNELRYTLKDLRMLLNNTEQGFLTLDKSVCVEPTFSKECERIFQQNITNVFFPSLVYPDDQQEAAFVEKIISTIQIESDHLKREAYLSLLPDKLVINGLFIEFDYKWIEDAIPGEMQLMIILNDATQRIALENEIEQERNKLSKMIKIVLNLEELNRIERDYRDFVSFDIHHLLNTTPTAERIAYVKRQLHTFKGAFASFGFQLLEQKMHEAEETIQCWSSNPSFQSPKLENQMMLSELDMLSWLDQEEALIKEELSNCIPCANGNIFKNEKTIKIDPELIESLRQRLKNLLTNVQHEKIDEALSILEKKKIKDFLNYYRFIVETIAEKLGKTIRPLLIEGDNIYIDPKKFSKWRDSLIHLFRNAIDHGIESIDERIQLNKPTYGQLSVIIEDQPSFLNIKISDDGRGLNLEQLKITGVEKGFLKPEQIHSIDTESVLDLIFIDGFTTKAYADLMSGRGTGLSVVKKEWEKIGGTISLCSDQNKGTTFIFKICKPL
ncbi:MAG TPA: ATP-binding protein [Thermotogota bacterium]|nr:ATP-binding protein [Thermotogota bacterium]HRW35729.1 ATP-binding protein [Thermotogota bacterium]